MLFKLNVDPLLKTEIQYELKVRGLHSDGNIANFPSNLRDVLREESQGVVKERPQYPFQFTEDYDVVSPLLTELESLITKLFSRPDKNLSLTIETKFSHSLGRLNNSNTIEDDEIAKENELFVKLTSLRTRYELFAMKFSSPVTSVVTYTSGMPTLATSDASVTTRVISCKSTPVAKWNLRFSGDQKGVSVNAFIERVNELMLARNVTKIQLFKEAWDWNSLVKLLFSEFRSVDYDERLLDEIKRRTQGSDESMRIFISVMRTMFSRMTEKLSAEKQLKIILRNISSFYQTHLGLPEIYSIDELLLYGRKIEERRYAIESYVPASRKRGNLEVDLAYIRTTSAETQSTAVVTIPEFQCWNCDDPDHRAVQCSRLRRKKFSYKCSKPEVTVASCPTCSQKRTKQGNGSTLIDERETKFMKNKVLLHYVLEHSTSDERPYVTVEIMGREILAY
ncbi:hypothetical protein ILUMI_15708 [Ignelater luminosus]|uniref:Uncharacterized protein n=1 Tax=Ignelater luminosus TaxID=2038154 RepID=A0A8K0CN60_IGNLU|nr:hypothetical protein ILUMI_15708 [Ignelater luminosus]